MTLARLIEELTFIADHTETTDVEVAVQGWEDNAYDGDKVEGIRLVNDRDYEGNKFNVTLFIVHGEGR